jgi:hypothetical protein
MSIFLEANFNLGEELKNVEIKIFNLGDTFSLPKKNVYLKLLHILDSGVLYFDYTAGNYEASSKFSIVTTESTIYHPMFWISLDEDFLFQNKMDVLMVQTHPENNSLLIGLSKPENV